MNAASPFPHIRLIIKICDVGGMVEGLCNALLEESGGEVKKAVDFNRRVCWK